MTITEYIKSLRTRGQDSHGAGWFGAPRSHRIHNGVDLIVETGAQVKSFTLGKVTKIGYPYSPADPVKGHLRYVEICFDGTAFRYFYISPLVKVGDNITPGMSIGYSQDLTAIYPGITQHFHFEIREPDGSYVDPSMSFPDLGTDTLAPE
jgi:murein DD-endopeptidase MepM/ murein hydrolase activator NlpD